MGNEVKTVTLGGAKIYNVEKAGIRENAKGQPIYCVWLQGGAYVEYPEQTPKPVTSYFAKDNKSGVVNPITEKTYKSNKTQKDGREFTFIKETSDNPTIMSSKIAEYEGKQFFEHLIDGFKYIRIYGGEHTDNIQFTNTTNGEAFTDNDSEKDNIMIMMNCKNTKYQIQEGVDKVNRWVGYEKKNGYYSEFKDK